METSKTSTASEQDFELWVLLHQTSDAMTRAREKELRKAGISKIEAGVLFALKHITTPATPAAISRWLFREPHTTSELLSRMQKKDLVRKAKDLERKNQVRVVMTEKGEEAYRQSREIEVIPRMLSRLSPAERNKLRTYLGKLRDKALDELGVEYQLPFPR